MFPDVAFLIAANSYVVIPFLEKRYFTYYKVILY